MEKIFFLSPDRNEHEAITVEIAPSTHTQKAYRGQNRTNGMMASVIDVSSGVDPELAVFDYLVSGEGEFDFSWMGIRQA